MVNFTEDEAKSLGIVQVFHIEKKDTNFTGEGVYVIEFSDGIKVGRSKNVAERLRQYNSPWIKDQKNVAVYACKNSSRLEKAILLKFKHNIAAKSNEYLINVSHRQVLDTIEYNKFYQSPRIEDLYVEKPKVTLKKCRECRNTKADSKFTNNSPICRRCFRNKNHRNALRYSKVTGYV